MNRTLVIAQIAAAALAGVLGLWFESQGNGVGWLVAWVAAGWLLCGAALAARRLLGIAVSALVGLGVSLYLGVQHLPATGTSFCSVSSTFDCDVVNRSQYSELAGVPIAFLGSAFYAAVVAVAVLALLRRDSYRLAGHLVSAGGAAAVLYSCFLLWASSQLGSLCLLCTSMYGVNALLLAGGLMASRESGVPVGEGLGRALRAADDRSMPAMLTAGVVVLIASMGWYNVEKSARAAVSPATAGEIDVTQLYAKPKGQLELDGTEPILGDPSAPYTIVEFADFECPHCALVAPKLHELVARDPQIRVMFKNYPISGLCNDQVEGARHEHSCGAAAAFECARAQGRAWEMNRLMFKNQAHLAPDELRFMARQVGLDEEAFSECLDAPATLDAVRADVASAARVGVDGTPTLFLRGVRGDEWVRVLYGPEEAELLVAAHRAGRAIPPAVPIAER